MADLNDIIKEIKNTDFQSPIDVVRKAHLNALVQHTKRNVICYYSGFLSSPTHPDIAISDKDLNGFMTVIRGLDKSKGLDLILHSPGGEVTATESIGNYLRKVFGKNIRVFVPHMAMSGGTMLACIGKEIYMGKHSSIGPFDPQFGGVPAYEVVQEYEEAKNDIINNPASIPFWQPILSKYPPTFIRQCSRAVKLSGEVVKEWLEKGDMFRGQKGKKDKIEKILETLNSNEHTKIHSRHIDETKAKELGLKINNLEDNNNLQEDILSVHHCYITTFQNTNAVKIIESNNGASFVIADNGDSQSIKAA